MPGFQKTTKKKLGMRLSRGAEFGEGGDGLEGAEKAWNVVVPALV